MDQFYNVYVQYLDTIKGFFPKFLISSKGAQPNNLVKMFKINKRNIILFLIKQ